MPGGRLTWLPSYLKRWGVPVLELPGWQTRGRPDMAGAGIVGHVAHHDASPAGSDLGFLGPVTNGRAGLPGPLGHLFLPRGTTPFGRAVRVVASGRANHAGVGSWRGVTGNHRVVGTEAANNGLGEPWTAWQLDMWPRICAAVIDGLRTEEGANVRAADCIDHLEWAPGRKVDRALLDPAHERQRISALLKAGPGEEDPFMALSDQEQRELLDRVRRVDAELDRERVFLPDGRPSGSIAWAVLHTNSNVGALAERPAAPVQVDPEVIVAAILAEFGDAIGEQVAASLARRLAGG